MNILHVTKKYPNALGGDSVVVSNLVKKQIADGHSVTILTSNCDEIKSSDNVIKFGLKDTSAGLDTISFRRLLSLFMLFLTAYKILKNKRPDVIHTHATDIAMVMSFAARHHKIPIVHTFHIVTFYYPQQAILRRKTEVLMAKVAKASIYTAPNIFDVKKLKKAGLTKVHLMPNGIDLDYWQKRDDTQYNKHFTFVTAGRLEEQKGYEYLIRAVSLLKETNKNFMVIIIGEGSEKNKLQELARLLGVLDYVVFEGRKLPDQIRNIYSSANAAVFPSLWETTPLTLLEAWAMRLPTIITPVGILRESKGYKNAVILVKKHDKSSLAKAMELVISNGNVRKNVVNAGIQHVQTFTWDKIYVIANGLYENAIISHKGQF